MIFVNSMSDLFHGKVPSRFIAAVFGVIAACPQHTFQVLTKRMGRAIAWLGELRMEAAKRTELGMVAPCVSALDEYLVATGESRLIPDYDPKAWPLPNLWFGTSCERQREADNRLRQLRSFDAAVRFASLEPLLEAVSLRPWQGIDWVVVGGESGPNARPFDPEWARYLVAECKTEGIPIFVKQLGSMVKGYQLNAHKGNDPEEWPKDLRVRQWPGEVE
jgi:protein gp37